MIGAPALRSVEIVCVCVWIINIGHSHSIRLGPAQCYPSAIATHGPRLPLLTHSPGPSVSQINPGDHLHQGLHWVRLHERVPSRIVPIHAIVWQTLLSMRSPTPTKLDPVATVLKSFCDCNDDSFCKHIVSYHLYGFTPIIFWDGIFKSFPHKKTCLLWWWVWDWGWESCFRCQVTSPWLICDCCCSECLLVWLNL